MREVISLILIALLQNPFGILGQHKPSSGGGGSPTITLNSVQTFTTSIGSGAARTVTSVAAGHSVIVGVLQISNATDTWTSAKLGASDTLTEVSPSGTLSWIGCAGSTADLFYGTLASTDTTLTVVNSGGHALYGWLWDLSSTSGSIAVDQHNNYPSIAGSNPTGPSITTLVNSELIAAITLYSSSGSAVASPFTFRGPVQGDGAADDVTTTTGTYSPSWTGGNTTCGTIVSVKG